MSSSPRRCVLILEPDASHAHEVEHILRERVGDVDVHHSGSSAQADVYLESAFFDAVIIRYETTMAEWLDRTDLSDLAVFILADGRAADFDALSEHGACLPLQPDRIASWHRVADLLDHLWHSHHDGTGADVRRKVLSAVDEAASSLKHEINNPLSIIAGNAQLLLELAAAQQLDGDMVEAIRNIETAARRASNLTGQLAHLRRHVAQHLYESDAPPSVEDCI